MRRKMILAIGTCVALVSIQGYPLLAEDFSGREEEMNQKCSAIYDEGTQQQCAAYVEYLNNKANNLESNVNNLQDQIAAVNGDINKVMKLIETNNSELTKANESLLSIQQSIEVTNASILQLNGQIEEKEKSIQLRDEQMKARLIEMQPYVGSNNYIDFLMGATSFTDLLRRTAVVGELNEYEQEQIEALNLEREELKSKQDDVKSKQELLKGQEQEVETQKRKIEAYKAANEELLVTYKEQEAALAEEKRKAQVESGAFAASIPDIDLSIIPQNWGGDTESGGNSGGESNSGNGGSNGGSSNVPDLSSGFIIPIQSGYNISAGTWAYPGGGEHLGLDFGTGYRTGLNVMAPAAGIVVAINDGVPNHGVYENGINSWTGYPSGGGNTLHMIVNVNGTSYGISFYHLSPGMFNVSVGSVVKQGQVIAHTGHSGNSTGPHCHVEVTNLGKVSINEGVQIFNRHGKDYFYGNYNYSGSCEVKGSTPCLERPEKFFLN